MITCYKTNFYAHKETINRLFQCNRTSGEVWNEVLRLAKEKHLATGKWITKSELQQATKGRFQLHSQSVQAVCHKYLFSRDSAQKARSKGYKTKYPYKQKRHCNTKWAKNGFTVHENGKIELSMGTWQGKRQRPLLLWVKNIPSGKIKEIELIYDRHLMLSMSVENGVEPQKKESGHKVAIDIGEIHTLASVCENGENLIITGRKMRSIHRLRNKKLKELQKKMSRCQKGSRKWKQYNRAKIYILSKSENQLRDVLHKTTRQFVSWCKENDVNEVIIGDVDGVQRNTSKRKKKKVRRRTTNQKLSNWSFGKTRSYLTYKLNAEGITLEKKDESFTSQTCPVCERRKKISSRNYRCKCGYQKHRDIHGASNFYAKIYYGGIKPLRFELKPVKYLRIA